MSKEQTRIYGFYPSPKGAEYISTKAQQDKTIDAAKALAINDSADLLRTMSVALDLSFEAFTLFNVAARHAEVHNGSAFFAWLKKLATNNRITWDAFFDSLQAVNVVDIARELLDDYCEAADSYCASGGDKDKCEPACCYAAKLEALGIDTGRTIPLVSVEDR